MKKLVSLFAAATMMLAVPSVAFALESPSAGTVTDSQSGVAISVSGAWDKVDSVVATSDKADNVPDGVTPLASFEVTGDLEGEDLTLTFSVGEKYAGYAVTIYIQHSDGTFEVKEGTVSANGTVSVTVDRLSTFSIVLGEAPAAGTTDGKTDTSATSPQTGVSMIPAAAVTLVSVSGAGAAAVALRKKSN